VATLVRYTGLAERTVRTCLDRLQTAGIIAPRDPGIVAARIKRADRLEAAGAFVMALAARRCWFCYQQLFAVRPRSGGAVTGLADVAALGRAFLGRALAGAEAPGQSPLCGPPAGPVGRGAVGG